MSIEYDPAPRMTYPPENPRRNRLETPDTPLPKPKKVTKIEIPQIAPGMTTVPGQAVVVTKKKLLAIPDIEAKVLARVDELVEAMFDLALGVNVSAAKWDAQEGEIVERIYSRPPDYKALAFLIENVIGKTPQRIEMTGKDGGPVQIIPYMTMPEAIRQGVFKVEPHEDEETTEAEFTEIPDSEAEDESSDA